MTIFKRVSEAYLISYKYTLLWPGRLLGWWVAGLNGNITNSAPDWVGLGLGAEIGKKDENNIARKAVLNKVILELKGLEYECQVISENIGLPNVMYSKVTKSEIKCKITEADLNEKKVRNAK